MKFSSEEGNICEVDFISYKCTKLAVGNLELGLNIFEKI